MAEATIHYLEMTARDQFQPASAAPGFWVKRVQPADPELNAWFYRRVGADWQWSDRLQWSAQDWRAYVDRAQLLTFVGYLGEQAAGFFELERQAENTVQLAYFGLLPEFIGQGLGGPFLSSAVARAWGLSGTRRVWVHTCNDDHPHALSNYRKRGFRRFTPAHY